MENPKDQRDFEIQSVIAEMIRTDQDIRDLERRIVILKGWKSLQESHINRLRQQRDETKP